MKTTQRQYAAFCVPCLGEEPAQLERLFDATTLELRPSNLIERDVAMEVVHNRWLLQRCARLKRILVSAEQTGDWDGPEARNVIRDVAQHERRLRGALRRSLATFVAIRRRGASVGQHNPSRDRQEAEAK